MCCVKMVSVRDIRSATAACALAKEADVAAKVRIVVITATKSRGIIVMDSIGGVGVLGPTEIEGTSGTKGGSDDASRASDATGGEETGVWGSSAGSGCC